MSADADAAWSGVTSGHILYQPYIQYVGLGMGIS